jgi:hypothetical protein
MIVHWVTHWVMGPHAFWGWVFDIASLIGLLWLLGCLFACLVSGGSSGGSSTSAGSRGEVAKLDAHRAGIDSVYDRAAQEVQRITREGRP